MKMRTYLVLAAAAITVVGCGGSSKTGAIASRPDSAQATSQRSTVAQAEAICRRLNDEFAANKPANQGIGEIVRLAPSRAVSEQRVVAELARLTPPASIAHSMREVIAYRRTLAAELAQLVRDAKAKDEAAIRVLARSKERMHKKLAVSAESAGVKACAQIG